MWSKLPQRPYDRRKTGKRDNFLREEYPENHILRTCTPCEAAAASSNQGTIEEYTQEWSQKRLQIFLCRKLDKKRHKVHSLQQIAYSTTPTYHE